MLWATQFISDPPIPKGDGSTLLSRAASEGWHAQSHMRAHRPHAHGARGQSRAQRASATSPRAASAAHQAPRSTVCLQRGTGDTSVAPPQTVSALAAQGGMLAARPTQRRWQVQFVQMSWSWSLAIVRAVYHWRIPSACMPAASSRRCTRCILQLCRN